jgi:hypothetical protein
MSASSRFLTGLSAQLGMTRLYELVAMKTLYGVAGYAKSIVGVMKVRRDAGTGRAA